MTITNLQIYIWASSCLNQEKMHDQITIATKDTVSCPYYTLFWKIKAMPHIHAKHERKTQKPKYKENLHAMIYR